jgi:glycine/sarcosine N-methyltransferase
MKYNEFYDSFSEFYDEMTRFELRIQNEKGFFCNLKSKYEFTNAIDIGCGTGAHTLILSECGADAVGIDPSKGMIEKAKLHLPANSKIEFINISLEDYSNRPNLNFDAAFCMGNSIPHITEKHDLVKFIVSLKKVLSPGALFTLQILNYEKILHAKERIVNIREIDDKIFIRFYDFTTGNNLNFNILTITGERNKREHNIISTSLYAYTLDTLAEIFSSYGFKLLQVSGDFKMSEFDKLSSPNLIMIFKNHK